jgi:hypothetical protein
MSRKKTAATLGSNFLQIAAQRSKNKKKSLSDNPWADTGKKTTVATEQFDQISFKMKQSKKNLVH